MAIITRGKFRGIKVRLLQIPIASRFVQIDVSNVDIPISRSVLDITCLDYNQKEINSIVNYKNKVFWNKYQIKPSKKDGRFVVRKIKLIKD